VASTAHLVERTLCPGRIQERNGSIIQYNHHAVPSVRSRQATDRSLTSRRAPPMRLCGYAALRLCI